MMGKTAFIFGAVVALAAPTARSTEPISDPLAAIQGIWVARSTPNGNDVIEVKERTITLKTKGPIPQIFQNEAEGTVIAVIVGDAEAVGDRFRFRGRCTGWQPEGNSGGIYWTDDCNIWLGTSGTTLRYPVLNIGISDFVVRPADKARKFM